MKIVIVNKSDSTGGAAVVSYRLLEALRSIGVDAKMLVVEKLTTSPYVTRAASDIAMKRAFLVERLKIFMANGFDRSTLFKIDTMSEGVDISSHPWVKQADAVLLNWVNQGMLSFAGLKRLIATGKRILWTMHDMWCFTGICHHAGDCRRYEIECGMCPLLKSKATHTDLSTKIFRSKNEIYPGAGITFVAVSHWLERLASRSALLRGEDVEVIPNAFKLLEYEERKPKMEDEEKVIVFGAARLDDPVKGWPILVEATRSLQNMHPEKVSKLRLVTFGDVRDASIFDNLRIAHTHLGRVPGQRLRDIYSEADIVLSTSLFETLPGTLVEGQAYGAVPVCLDRGGQRDIVGHRLTGYLADWDDNPAKAGANIAEGILWATEVGEETRRAMYCNVKERFSYEAVAKAYVKLCEGKSNIL